MGSSRGNPNHYVLTREGEALQKASIIRTDIVWFLTPPHITPSYPGVWLIRVILISDVLWRGNDHLYWGQNVTNCLGWFICMLMLKYADLFGRGYIIPVWAIFQHRPLNPSEVPLAYCLWRACGLKHFTCWNICAASSSWTSTVFCVKLRLNGINDTYCTAHFPQGWESKHFWWNETLPPNQIASSTRTLAS